MLAAQEEPMSSDSSVSRREDEVAIRDLAYRYARIVDRHVYEEIPLVFMPDCELSGQGFRMKGHAELDAGLRKIEMYSATQHCVQNQLTRVEGDRATGEFYCVANHIHVRDGVSYKLDMGIRYEDRYVRTAEGWRIAQRTLILIWQQDLPLDLSVAGISRSAPSRSATPRSASARGKAVRTAGGGRKRATGRKAGGAKARASSVRAASEKKTADKKTADKKTAAKKKTGQKKSGKR
jgi:SnoaL-like domain